MIHCVNTCVLLHESKNVSVSVSKPRLSYEFGCMIIKLSYYIGATVVIIYCYIYLYISRDEIKTIIIN